MKHSLRRNTGVNVAIETAPTSAPAPAADEPSVASSNGADVSSPADVPRA